MTLSITLDSESCYAEIVVYAEFHLFIYSAECLGTIYVTKLRCVSATYQHPSLLHLGHTRPY